MGARWKDQPCAGADRGETGWVWEINNISVFSMKQETRSSNGTWEARR